MTKINRQEIKQKLADWPVRFRAYAQANDRKAIWQMITSFGPFLALWVLMYFSLRWSYWLTFALALINGFFLVRIFIIQHDCGHRSFFKSQRVNKRLSYKKEWVHFYCIDKLIKFNV